MDGWGRRARCPGASGERASDRTSTIVRNTTAKVSIFIFLDVLLENRGFKNVLGGDDSENQSGPTV